VSEAVANPELADGPPPRMADGQVLEPSVAPPPAFPGGLSAEEGPAPSAQAGCQRPASVSTGPADRGESAAMAGGSSPGLAVGLETRPLGLQEAEP
jgi:hypothetical protein